MSRYDSDFIPPPHQPDLKIEGYGLLLEGAPLLVRRSSSDLCEHEHYVLSKREGMPYLVDLHTLRYYLTYGYSRKGWCPQYAPEPDPHERLLDNATPCYMTISMEVGNPFSLRVDARPMGVPLELYKILPHDCLQNTKGHGPLTNSIIKVLKYEPISLGGTYVDDNGFYLDTYWGPVGDPLHYLFVRENRYPEFYETLEMGTILSLHRRISHEDRRQCR